MENVKFWCRRKFKGKIVFIYKYFCMQVQYWLRITRSWCMFTMHTIFEQKKIKGRRLVIGLLVHKVRGKAFYDLLRDANSRIAIFLFDCHKNLPFPKIPNQTCYVNMQINLNMFTVLTGHSKFSHDSSTVRLFVWTESDHQRGSNGIVSPFFTHWNI